MPGKGGEMRVDPTRTCRAPGASIPDSGGCCSWHARHQGPMATEICANAAPPRSRKQTGAKPAAQQGLRLHVKGSFSLTIPFRSLTSTAVDYLLLTQTPTWTIQTADPHIFRQWSISITSLLKSHVSKYQRPRLEIEANHQPQAKLSSNP